MLHRRVKELPRRVNRRVVTASVFLGWKEEGVSVPGYRCFVVAQDMSVSDDPMVCAYTLRATGIDAPWQKDEEWFNISVQEARDLILRHIDPATGSE